MILSQILLFYLNERTNETLCKYFWYSIFKLDRSLQFHPWKSKALLCVRFKFPMSNMCCPHVLGLVWCMAVSSLVSWCEQGSSVLTAPRILVSRGRQHNDHTPQQCCCCWAAAAVAVVVTSHLLQCGWLVPGGLNKAIWYDGYNKSHLKLYFSQ